MEKILIFALFLSAVHSGSGSPVNDSAARAVQDIPLDVTILTCLGQNVTLPGGVSQPSSDAGDGQIVRVGWLKNDGDQENLLAVNTSGHFFSNLGTRRALLHVPDKGVTLPGVREADLGNYTVRVHSVRQGVLHAHNTRVVLNQQDDIQLDEDKLQIHIADDVIYDNSTDEWHVQIMCGRFLSEVEDHVTVTWQTPSNQLLNSTRSDNGHFVLHVPNPVEQGVYSCLLQTDRCHNRHFVSGKAANLSVNSVEQRLRVLESSMSSLQGWCSREHCVTQPEQPPSQPPSSDLAGVVHDGEYILAFRLTPGIGKSSYDTYTKVGYNDDVPLVRTVMPAGCLTVDGSQPCDRHYRSKVLDLWDGLRVEKARVSLYVNGSEVAFFEFSAVGENYINWFKAEKLTNSSYTDVLTEPKNYCSIQGHTTKRRFYINRNFGGCPADRGWLIVWDGADPCRPTWGADPPYPVVGYMHGNTVQLLTSTYLRHADVLAIWVKIASDASQ
ncbi:uncharacterized protein LOC143286462 [Babylonia areolata]|uniref:uncharacterized protein LOC143286462 n=1 Tax=Babylonia areolata TaxID=304850 RepID=UPI003FD47FFE